ncbi:eukaryotic translation initiation factor 2-alpha kinase 3-like [Denticeps clupeoides]|uniref:eukaryotic translation initiation factor 2-alpha kinase 3-like n=1 Tax=Denticeps clupeoides TaxID=299321 RepID=UPI0010A42CE3|nr:eukaryotic translation initiation factor 2-alpha kinase 3-like [Denticeps clupeoides]
MDISVLGHGAYGRVYKAWSNKDQKNFAVKIVGNSKKSEREVKALARLQHHNIVKYFCCWEEDNKYEQESSESSDSSTSSSTNFLYIQMELCEGGTLRDWIEAKNSTPCPARRQEARNIIEQITDGLAFIHSKKLVHRDLKPENIFFEEQKIKIKIGDFGLVKNIALNTDESPPEGHESFGTPTYMSPEQKSGGLYGKKADIFALGLIFFELLWTLQTQMEKYTIWTDLRDQMFPEHFNVQFPPECKLIKMMLCKKTKKRPGAAGLLTEIKKLY